MKHVNLLRTLACVVVSTLVLPSYGDESAPTDFQQISVSVCTEKVMGIDAIRVTKDMAVKAFDEPTFARITGAAFKDGTIEVRVFSRLLKDAPDFARGFIGIAFRINDDNSKFECIYVRPANARVDDQVRRNHSIQYFAYPDFKFERLRKESPEKYESYADMGLNEWIDLTIDVKGTQAKLYVNGHKQPALVVNDLKLGPDTSGSVGLWVDVGTEGYFANLKITPR